MAKAQQIINKTYALDQVPSIAQEVIQLFPEATIFLCTGSLGAGKTTLIKEILRQCGVEEHVTSPTFTYMNQYRGKKGDFYHFDLYRISSADAFFQAGFGEYLHMPKSWVFIEWPEILDGQISGALSIDISHKGLGLREIKIERKR